MQLSFKNKLILVLGFNCIVTLNGLPRTLVTTTLRLTALYSDRSE